MAGIIKKYVFGDNRLKRSLLDGFELCPGGVLKTTGQERRVRNAFIGGLDGVDEDTPWGRVSARLEAQGDCVLTLRAIASNDPSFIRKGVLTSIDSFLLDEAVTPEIKEQFFGVAGGLEHSGAEDVLLYGLKGRYLYLWIEIEGSCQARLSELSVFVPGDNFTQTFPAVYQNEENDFFRRFMSIFSTMYNSLQDSIDTIDEFFDPDTTFPAALRHFASWMGIETEGSLTQTQELRKVVKAAPELLRYKGTKKAIELVVGLFVEDPFYVVERNLLTSQQLECEMYGVTPYDFSILINREPDEPLRACLEFFIDQFKPICSRCKIVFFGSGSGLDSFTYLDFNGTVKQSAPGQMDKGKALTGLTYLK